MKKKIICFLAVALLISLSSNVCCVRAKNMFGDNSVTCHNVNTRTTGKRVNPFINANYIYYIELAFIDEKPTILMNFYGDKDIRSYNVKIKNDSTTGKTKQIFSRTVQSGETLHQKVAIDGSGIFFAQVTPLYKDGSNGKTIISYVMLGNVVGTFNDGVPYSEAKVDDQDKCLLQLWYYRQVYHRTANGDLILPFTDKERLDWNKDGLINVRDYNVLKHGFVY